jgi:hypothetical protein
MRSGRPITRLLVLALLAVACKAVPVQAQEAASGAGFDTAYVKDYSHILTVRAYSSTKYNKLKLGGLGGTKALIYRPNNQINLGMGVSYRSLTLNLGFGAPFLNKDQGKKGETRYLDAQANIYTKRWATNLFLQRFQGYFLEPYTQAELGWHQQTLYPTRPDLVQYNVGVSTVHVFNNDRFSYRAAFNQDAWQRKSQGSLLVGGYLTYFHLQADSSLVPAVLTGQYDPGLQLRRSGFLDLGPGVGYAYTVVYKEHLFLTASFVMGGGLSIQQAATRTREIGEVVRGDVGLGWHGQYRAGLGYNSAKYYVGLSFNQENIGYLLEDRSSFYWSVGNIRLNVVKRFNLRIPILDNGLRWFGKEADGPTG